MKAIALIIVTGGLILGSRTAALCQTDEPYMRTAEGPRVFSEALRFWDAKERSTRLDVYVEVPYAGLHFAKQGDVFRASYDVTIDIHDSTDRLIADKYWTEKVETRSYDESISPRANRLSQESFELAPGQYTLIVQTSDPDTKKGSQVKRKVVIRDLTGEKFFTSDAMIVNRIDTIGEKRLVYPNISGNVGNLPSGFYIYFEVYSTPPVDSVEVRYAVRDFRGGSVLTDSMHDVMVPSKKSVFMKVNSQKLIAGDYLLDVTSSPLPKRKDSVVYWTTTRPFGLYWHGLPVAITDLDKAIDQMQYITDKNVIDEMKQAPPEKKKAMFEDFWKKRDPSAGTERNELMEEYYSRVDYANKHFSHYIEGWKTDMGMIYIIFGMPNNIERHPFDMDAKPYEIWTYYEQNREFVFIDATGFGDYRLQNPMWDLWRTRPR